MGFDDNRPTRVLFRLILDRWEDIVNRISILSLFWLLPAVALAQQDGLSRARALLESMREVVREVEGLAEQTREDAVKQTCIVGAHREMSEVIASVEKAVEEAASQGADAHGRALQTAQAGLTTVQQLRDEMYECVGPEEVGAAARTYDPVRSSRERERRGEDAGLPALRPPAASATR